MMLYYSESLFLHEAITQFYLRHQTVYFRIPKLAWLYMTVPIENELASQTTYHKLKTCFLSCKLDTLISAFS